MNIPSTEIEYLIFCSDNPSINKYLTKWQKYEASIYGKYCNVYNDLGQYRKYRIDYFMTVSEYREKLINDILIDI